jgi:hypothetical protein
MRLQSNTAADKLLTTIQYSKEESQNILKHSQEGRGASRPTQKKTRGRQPKDSVCGNKKV